MGGSSGVDCAVGDLVDRSLADGARGRAVAPLRVGDRDARPRLHEALAAAAARWLLCAIVAISLFSLGTRLFPNVLRVYDPTAINRLAQPIGYWNGLSVFTALGIVLALGFAAHGRTRVARTTAAALLVPLLATFYFTFGRTGWIALAAGALVTSSSTTGDSERSRCSWRSRRCSRSTSGSAPSGAR